MHDVKQEDLKLFQMLSAGAYPVLIWGWSRDRPESGRGDDNTMQITTHCPAGTTEVSRGKKMALRGTDPESYITEYT